MVSLSSLRATNKQHPLLVSRDKEIPFFGVNFQLSQLKTDLRQLGVSLADFAAKVLGDARLSDSVLSHQPCRLDELDSEVLPKFLLIQQWLCQPSKLKLESLL